MRTSQIRFCFECADFPCRRLKTIDNRYRTRYSYSFIENLQEIKKSGIEEFLRRQEKRFKCPDCGGVISVHDGKCYDCARLR